MTHNLKTSVSSIYENFHFDTFNSAVVSFIHEDYLISPVVIHRVSYVLGLCVIFNLCFKQLNLFKSRRVSKT